MKSRLKKLTIRMVSYLICILMIFSMIPFSSLALTNSYIADTIVKVTVLLPKTTTFTGIESVVEYGSSLSLVSGSLTTPNMSDAITNTSIGNQININGTNISDGYDISSDHILCTANFKVLKDVSSLDISCTVADIYLVKDDETFVDCSKTVSYKVEAISVPDRVIPTGSISSTNNIDTKQTVNLSLSDDKAVAGYYWGTSATYSNNSYSVTSSTSATKTITSPGTYYLTVKDTSNNVSVTQSVTFYKVTFEANGGSVTPSYVLMPAGKTFTFPTPTRSGYTYLGWSTSSSATEGVTTLAPTSTTTYYAIWQKNDVSAPTATIQSTNIVADNQTVTLTFSDDQGIEGYYWGTNSTYFNNPFTSTSETVVERTVSISGTYYLAAKDINGNVSTVKSIKFYKTTLDANGGSVYPTSVLTASGNSFTFPTPTKNNYTCLGWSTSTSSGSGVSSLTPSADTTYYAIWKRNDTTSPVGAVTSTNNVDSSQTVTLEFADDTGIAGYYWGTSALYTNNTFTETSETIQTKTITEPGTYYLTVKDTSGNVSISQSIKFYKTTLDANGGDVSVPYIITASGESFSFPTPTNGMFTSLGWATSSNAKTGVTTLTPTSNATYYAVWQKSYSLVGTINGENVGCDEDYESTPNVFVDGTQTLIFNEDSYVFIKTTDNNDWYMFTSYCEKTSGKLYNTTMGTSEKMFVPAGVITFTLVENNDGTLTLSYEVDELFTKPTTEEPTSETVPTETTAPTPVYLAGDFTNWQQEEMERFDTIVTITKELEAGTYKFKIVDGLWHGNDGTIEDTTITTSPIGWQMDSSKGDCTLKASGGTYVFNYNVNTKMLMVLYTPKQTEPTTEETEPSTEETEPTPVYLCGSMHNWEKVEMDKFSDTIYTTTTILEAGTYKFKIVDTAWYGNNSTVYDTTATVSTTGLQLSTTEGDCTLVATAGTYTFNYNKETKMLVINFVPAPTTEPTTVTEPPKKEFSLVGYINGADVGCNEDYMSVPNVFEDGKQTLTFEKDSYVFVKTTDNSEWYMFPTQCTSTSGVLFNTNRGTSEKMFVPAGVITFTVVENSDGTLTLSYVVDELFERPTESGDTQPTTESTEATEPPEAYLCGSFNNWEHILMERVGDIVSTTIELEAGTYKFKVFEGGKWYGNSGIIENTTITTSPFGWLMDPTETECRLTSTGGTYLFSYNTSTKMLVVIHTPPATTEPLPTETTPKEYSLIGNINGIDTGFNTDKENVGYKFEDGKVTVTSEQNSYVFVKTTDNAEWYMFNAYCQDTSGVLYDTKIGTNEKMFVPAGVVTFTLAENTDGSLTLSYVVDELFTKPTTDTEGESSESTVPTDPIPVYLSGTFNQWEKKEMEKFGDLVTTTLELKAGTYKFKIVEDVAWLGNNGVIEDTTLTNSDVGWEMTREAGDCSLIASGGTYVFNYNTVSKMLVVLYTPPATTEPVPKEYSLVGNINGIDTGFNTDVDNDGYVFEDGKVTVTSEQNSYVFVKTTDNAEWYMFNAYCEDTSGILYDTKIGTNEKMFVPAGVVTFTLVENTDGTLTLSYVIDELFTKPTTDTENESSESTVPTDPIPIYISGSFTQWGQKEMDSFGDLVTTTVELEKGVYKFKIVEDALWYGNNGIIYDTTLTNSDFGWEMTREADNCTLDATGGTYVFNYNKNTKMLIVLHTPPETTEPTSSEETVPLSKEYSLVGYINGMDTGFNSDEANPGYLFKDGSLVIKVEQSSYVFVKTVDNANWYMFNEYCTDTVGKLYSVDSLMDGNKMSVEPGIYRFTLSETVDGALILFYTEVDESELNTSEPTSSETESSETTSSETESSETTSSETESSETTSSETESSETTSSETESSETTSSETESSETTSSETESTEPSTDETGSTAPSTDKTEDTKPTTKPTTPRKPVLKLSKKVFKAGERVTAKVLYADGKKIKWGSSKKKVATVSGKGVVKALGKGKTYVVARVAGYKLKTKIKVTTSPQLLYGKKKATTITVKKGSYKKVKIKGKVADVKNEYRNTRIAKFKARRKDSTLKVVGLKKGTTTIYVKTNRHYLFKLKVKVK